MIYIFITLLLLLLSFYYDIGGKEKGRDQWYFMIMVVLILLAGLRYRLGIDTPNYIEHFYHDIPTVDQLTLADFSIGNKPLWTLINSIVLSLGGRYFIVQIIEAAFVNILVFKYVKRHSRYIFTCIFFYFLCMYLSLSFVVMKAAMSIVICLFANDFASQKQWSKAYVLYFLAALFHPQTIVIMLTPLFMFLRLDKKSAALFIFLFFLGFGIQKLLGDYLALFDIADDAIAAKAENVANSDRYSSQTGNTNFLIVKIFPFLLYSLFTLLYLKRYRSSSALLKFEPYIIMYLGCLILEINVYICYRFAMYYIIYFLFYISDAFVEIAIQGQKKLSVPLAVTRSFMIILPFVFLIEFGFYKRWWVYNPYSSVIERRIDKTRENNRHEIHPYGPSANKNEY